jgi:hypothetical protein
MADKLRGRVRWQRIAGVAGVLAIIGVWWTKAAVPFFAISRMPGATERTDYAIVFVSMFLGAIAVATLGVAAAIAAFFDIMRAGRTPQVASTRGTRRPNPA